MNPISYPAGPPRTLPFSSLDWLATVSQSFATEGMRAADEGGSEGVLAEGERECRLVPFGTLWGGWRVEIGG